MKDKINHQELRATATYKKNMTESMKGLGQRIDKGSTNYCFVFGSCFHSKRSGKSAKDIFSDFVGIVKTYTKSL